MKRIFTVCFLSILFFACKNSNTQNKPVTINDIMKLYKPLSTPVNFFDSILKKIGDTSTISAAVFTQFIPDTAIQRILSASASKYIIHPAGIIHFKETDYLVTKFTSGKIAPGIGLPSIVQL